MISVVIPPNFSDEDIREISWNQNRNVVYVVARA